jgi:hypothetical protein
MTGGDIVTVFSRWAIFAMLLIYYNGDCIYIENDENLARCAWSSGYYSHRPTSESYLDLR